MSAEILSVENRKLGEYRVDVNLNGRRARFPSMYDATKWIELMKKSGDIDRIWIALKEVVITAKQQFTYESCYAY